MVGHFFLEVLPIAVAALGLIGGIALVVRAIAPPGRTRWRLLAFGMVLVCAGLLAGGVVGLKALAAAVNRLGDPPSTYVGLRNDTDRPIAIYYAPGGAESLQMVLWPDQSEFLKFALLDRESRCTTADLVFRDAFEAELGRLPPPVCVTRMVSLGQCVDSALQPPPPCVLPTARPRPSPSPSPTPEPTRAPPPTLPPGGISQEEAIRIAQSHVPPPRRLVSASWGELDDVVFSDVVPDVPRDRLVWAIWLDTAAQPACPSGADCLPTIPYPVLVVLDYRSGDFITTFELWSTPSS